MEGKEGKSKGDEDKKLGAILDRYDALIPKVAETRSHKPFLSQQL